MGRQAYVPELQKDQSMIFEGTIYVSGLHKGKMQNKPVPILDVLLQLTDIDESLGGRLFGKNATIPIQMGHYYRAEVETKTTKYGTQVKKITILEELDRDKIEKYYTPGIEEFYVGFEYEYRDTTEVGSSGLTAEWTECVGDFDSLSIAFSDYEHNSKFSELYRVKYLDREDIMELGFYQSPDNNNHFSLDGVTVILEGLEIHKGRRISIISDSRLFKGFVKNKSVLENLLKCLY